MNIKQLDKFVGQWITEGKIPATGTTPEIRISGTDTYGWLPGEFFLLHRVNVVVGTDINETFEIIGFDKLKMSIQCNTMTIKEIRDLWLLPALTKYGHFLVRI